MNPRDSSESTYRFGPFELRPVTRQLLVEGKPAALGARAFDVLLALVERRDRLVTKDELLVLAWPGLVVEENNLQVQVSTLRKILGADAIATIPSQGYRFALQLDDTAPRAPSDLLRRVAPSSERLDRLAALPRLLQSLNASNLPVQPTGLVGRKREVEQILSLARDSRVLTLTGPGGAGKTRLAIEAGAQMLERYPDGVCFVPLASVTEANLVYPAIASVIRATDDLAVFLRSKRMLLILDNLEQLLPDVAPLIGALAASPGLGVLATSRERLGISGEQEYAVPMLRPDEAVELFTARARQLKPEFQDDANVPLIVRRLDALPLAIELAAARIKVLTTKQIFERLTRSLEILAGGARDAPVRHQTLSSTIEWSYSLLSPQERQVFTSLGVFQGGFDFDAAVVVALADLELLSSLVDKSLLRQTDDGRFSMLNALRDYAALRLEASTGRDDVRRRHAEFMLARAVRGDMDKAEWRKLVDRDYADFRAALAWLRDMRHPDLLTLAARLSRFWSLRDRLDEGGSWLTEALATCAGGAGGDRIHALTDLASIALRQGNVDAARNAISPAMHEAQRLGDELVLAWTIAVHASIEWAAGDLLAARCAFERTEELCRVFDDRTGLVFTLCDLGMIAVELGDIAAARRYADDALSIARQHAERYTEVYALSLLGSVAASDGELEEAAAALHGSLKLALDIGDVRLKSVFDLYTLALVKARSGEAAAARVLVGAADAYLERIGAVREPLREKARAAVFQIIAADSDRGRVAEERSRGAAMSLEEAMKFACSLV